MLALLSTKSTSIPGSGSGISALSSPPERAQKSNAMFFPFSHNREVWDRAGGKEREEQR